MQVEISNDNNDPDTAKKLADQFVFDPTVFAVVGHNSSDASIAAARVYQQGGLVMISPTSTADQLSGIGSYVFRTVSSDSFDARALTPAMDCNRFFIVQVSRLKARREQRSTFYHRAIA